MPLLVLEILDSPLKTNKKKEVWLPKYELENQGDDSTNQKDELSSKVY